jgi:hypothetical protein
MGVDAVGTLQDDGTLQATLVLIHERRDGPPPQGDGEPGEGQRPDRPGQPGNETPPADENGIPDQRPTPDADAEERPTDAEAPVAPDNNDEIVSAAADDVYAEDGKPRDDTTYFSTEQQQNGLVVFLPLMHG